MTEKEQKQKLREILLARRSQISEKAYLQKSSQIISQLKNLQEFKQAGVVHCYVSMNQRREVNTHPLLKAMIDVGKRVVVPITQMEMGTLKHVELQSIDNLRQNEWGVLEPVNQKEVPVDEFDLVVVPMAGGDRRKSRLGYGKGFYDRFLAQVSSSKIGLLFEECLVDEIPTEPFDVSLNKLVTQDVIIH